MVEKAKELSVALEASFVAVVANSDGALQEGEGSSGLTAWDAVSGRIPILWTASVEKAGVKREDYEKATCEVGGPPKWAMVTLCMSSARRYMSDSALESLR